MDRYLFPESIEELYKPLDIQLRGNGFKEESIQGAIDSVHECWGQAVMLKRYSKCSKCSLTCDRKVPGIGNIDSPLMIVGEGPAATEVAMRMPLVGVCGLTLTMMLNKLGISRNRVYITNAVKCTRFDENGKWQNPDEHQIAACIEHLLMEIQVVQPKVILALGTKAMWALLFDFKAKISEQRGKVLKIHPDYEVDAKLVCTYHPSYLLRQGNTPKAQEIKKIMFNDIYGAVELAKRAAPYYDFNKKPLFLNK